MDGNANSSLLNRLQPIKLLQSPSWHYIANGRLENAEWYRQHDQPQTVPNVDEYVEAHRNQVDLPNVTPKP